MNRLPKPDPIPTRAAEKWVVRPEPYCVPVEPGGYCNVRRNARWCQQPAVAATTRGTGVYCADHLREGLMWIEDGHVVSWCLVPGAETAPEAAA